MRSANSADWRNPDAGQIVDKSKEADTAALYVAATPIGNLSDVTLRTLEVLRAVDVIAAEDTRITRRLLDRHGIAGRLVAAHEHNERSAASRIVELLDSGQSVALVSDAGTPAVADPGARVVAAVRAAGHPVVPLPGANAAVTAVCASGFDNGRFLFCGFLPARPAERRTELSALAAQTALLVFYEAPHRIVDCVADLAAVLGGGREIVIARELTKIHESIHRCRLDEAGAWLGADDNRRRGEFVLVVEGAAAAVTADDAEEERVLGILMEELPLKQAVALAAGLTGRGRNALYERALRLKQKD